MFKRKILVDKKNKVRTKELWKDQLYKILDAMIYFGSFGKYEGTYEMDAVHKRLLKASKKLQERKNVHSK